MSQAELFETLGAPLKNVRWSWGGVRKSDGAVFLRVWQDGTKKINGKRYIWISVENPLGNDLGENERMDHLKLVQAGHPCYLVMCQAVDTSAAPRAIQRLVAGSECNTVIELKREHHAASPRLLASLRPSPRSGI